MKSFLLQSLLENRPLIVEQDIIAMTDPRFILRRDRQYGTFTFKKLM